MVNLINTRNPTPLSTSSAYISNTHAYQVETKDSDCQEWPLKQSPQTLKNDLHKLSQEASAFFFLSISSTISLSSTILQV